MFRLNKQSKNERGLTLIELLASIVLLSIVSIFIFSIVTKTIENNRIIQQETMLRDEADIIVSKFIKTLYSTKQGYIIRNTTNNAGNSYIEVTNDLEKCKKNEEGVLIDKSACDKTLKPLGFKTVNGVTSLYILDEQYSIINPKIKVLSTSQIKGDPNSTTLYEVKLTLQITHKRGNKEIPKQMTFINQIQPILTSK
jgi:prepilin-type N-terminal cleavage/methylation domain-containing protein